jgi:hypothetical protein
LIQTRSHDRKPSIGHTGRGNLTIDVLRVGCAVR